VHPFLGGAIVTDELSDHDRQLGFLTLSVEECWHLVRAHRLGRVAFVHLGATTVVPVSYVVDGNLIVFRAPIGSVVAAAGCVGGQVVLQVDAAADARTSVLVHGELSAAEPEGDRELLCHISPAELSGRAIVTWPSASGFSAADDEA
jgi:nitroimidazol reductase NimA-like FMN-containing flavoprotein (pyridoxamine 5'-phosphate oxidase superfamily)